ncbi:hypothetical protein QYE76_011502 [Lolium multiflorum]|uniref:Transposase (putative) gypsy type domain-containing protein n=1 Tax=Lolium multiflorum TaxID=4521 RepID=A0AAD8X428_LOLMU|nr:hypothetical protein QYE76_011502 [Lolium multiflorum]
MPIRPVRWRAAEVPAAVQRSWWVATDHGRRDWAWPRPERHASTGSTIRKGWCVAGALRAVVLYAALIRSRVLAKIWTGNPLGRIPTRAGVQEELGGQARMANKASKARDRFVKDNSSPAPEVNERVFTKAWVERGLSLPPSDFFLEVLNTYGMQPHNICPNAYTILSSFVTLCEGI